MVCTYQKWMLLVLVVSSSPCKMISLRICQIPISKFVWTFCHFWKLPLDGMQIPFLQLLFYSFWVLDYRKASYVMFWFVLSLFGGLWKDVACISQFLISCNYFHRINLLFLQLGGDIFTFSTCTFFSIPFSH